MKTQLHYSTFDEKVNILTTDLPTLSLEGKIDPQKLLPTVIKINYDLGLKFATNKLKMLEVRKGRVRLPADFSVANYALLCGGKSANHPAPAQRVNSYTEGFLEGALVAQLARTPVGQFTVTRTIEPGDNIITHTLGTTRLQVQAIAPSGDITDFTVRFPDDTHVILHSEAGVNLENVQVILQGAAGALDMTHQPELCEVVRELGKLHVYHLNEGRRDHYPTPVPLRFSDTAQVADDCRHLFRVGSVPEVRIKDGWLLSPVEDGRILLSYQSVLENDEGELMTLNHPKVNEWYTYALKVKVFEDLWLDGGEEVERKLVYLKGELRKAVLEGLSFCNTPDFQEMRKTHQMNRRAMHQKYYAMFTS